MQKIKQSISLIFLIPILCNCMKGKKVDQLFHNASIICMDDNNTIGEAMAIDNGKIIEIGPERQILNKYRADETIDVKGREILPAFSDCNLHLDTLKKWDSVFLEEIETQELEQGIVEVYIHGINYKQLQNLLFFSPKMQLIWHIYLTPSSENIKYVRKMKRIKKDKNFRIAGFTLSNENKSTILEACSVAKNNFLQIGINLELGEKNIPLIIQSLKNHKLDHRWFVFNIIKKQNSTLKILEINNFFLCFNELNNVTSPIYIFGSSRASDKLLDKISNYSNTNSLVLLNSLKSITNWANYISFSEKFQGTLEKGKNANFSIFESPLSKIKEYKKIYSTTTYWNGKEIYNME